MHRYDFLLDSYDTERLKTLAVWTSVTDGDIQWRSEPRARTPLEHMVHQCTSEESWMRTMLDVNIGSPPLPAREGRDEFISAYAAASEQRLIVLRSRPEAWFEDVTTFFDVTRSRSWILLRRLTHSAHHRGQLTALLRSRGHSLYSTYGPTADTGGLLQHGGTRIYRFGSIAELLQPREAHVDPPLPGPGERPPTERPE